MALPISMSVCNYDRTAALFDGRVRIEGCDVAAVQLVPELCIVEEVRGDGLLSQVRIRIGNQFLTAVITRDARPGSSSASSAGMRS